MTHGPYIDAGSELDPVHPVELPEPARATGLTTAEVAERVARGEVNDVPVRSSRSTAEIVRANVFTRFNAIIGVLWVIMMFVAPIQDSLFGFVIIANTGIGIFQEYRAKKTLDGLAVIGEAKPTVRRDGVPGEISTSNSSSATSSNWVRATRSWSTARPSRPTVSKSTSRCSPGRPTRCTRSRATR